MTYVLRSGLSLLTQRRRQDLPVRARRPLDRMELQSRGPCFRTYSIRISSSSAIHVPFLIAIPPSSRLLLRLPLLRLLLLPTLPLLLLVAGLAPCIGFTGV